MYVYKIKYPRNHCLFIIVVFCVCFKCQQIYQSAVRYNMFRLSCSSIDHVWRNLQHDADICVYDVVARYFYGCVNTRRQGPDGRHLGDDIFKCNFDHGIFNFDKKSLKLVPRGRINNTPALVQIMAWHRSGDKPLSEPIMFSSLMHIQAPLGFNEFSLIVQALNYFGKIRYNGCRCTLGQWEQLYKLHQIRISLFPERVELINRC